MLDRASQQILANADRREAGGDIFALVFFGAAGTAMVAWIAAIIWISWHLIEWILERSDGLL